jgi:hypothetical protein
LGKLATWLLNTVRILAAESGKVIKAAFVSYWLRERSVQMARDHGMLFRVACQGLARAGRNMQAGLLQPGSNLN